MKIFKTFGLLAFILQISLGAPLGFADPIYKPEIIEFELNTGVQGQKVYLSSNLISWDDQRWPMEEVAPGLYRIEVLKPWAEYMMYKFIINGYWQLDPDNPDTYHDGTNRNSILYFPEFEEDPILQPWPTSQHWSRKEFTIKDGHGREREVILIYPTGLTSREKLEAKLLIFQDGWDYLNLASAENFLKNMSVGNTYYTGLFVPPIDRMKEYDFDSKYIEFLALSLTPKVIQFLGIGINAENRLLIGPSLGGLISLYAGLQYPDVFPNILCQSGSLFFRDLKILDSLRRGGPALNIYMDYGIFEGQSLVNSQNPVFNALLDFGHNVGIEKTPTRHDWFAWRNRLQTGVEAFFQ